MEQLTKEHTLSAILYQSQVPVWNNTQQYFFIHFTLLSLGRAPDIHIVWDSGFLKIGAIWPSNGRTTFQNTEYRVTCFFFLPAILCIPPSVKTCRQILSQAVNLTSRIANMQNYVE